MTARGQVGFVMLAHARLDRASAVARHLSAGGMPGVVHLDNRLGTEARKSLVKMMPSEVPVIAEHAAKWGKFGLVAATLAGVENLLSNHPHLSHICLISGSCLPLRPVSDLVAFLADHLDTDFIESVPVADRQWVEDGLSIERFTLFHPISQRDHPWWFSRSVDLQRMLRLRRRLPRGLEPHLGAQWWCLSAKTLKSILDRPERARWTRFFRSTWIPDESFFQTLVRVVRPDRSPKPRLHLSRFNRAGRPITFHDDHADYLSRSDHFFARKIDPDADALYARFLDPGLASNGTAFAEHVDEAPFNAARARFENEGAGLLGPGRLPKGTTLTRCDTVRPYLVVISQDAALLDNLLPQLRGDKHVVHGRLFEPDAPAAFACGTAHYSGNLAADPNIRDLRPAQFLSRLLWADRDRPTAFLLGPVDCEGIRYQLVQDPNARLLLLADAEEARETMKRLSRPFEGVRGASELPLRAWHQAVDPAPLRAEFARSDGETALQTLLSVVQGPWDRADAWSVPK